MQNKLVLLHILGDDMLFAEKYVTLLDEELSDTFKHLYCFTCSGRNLSTAVRNKENLFVLGRSHNLFQNYIRLIQALWIADKVFIHGVKVINIINPILTLIPFFKRRTYWVIWGHDLYFHNLNIKPYVLFNLFKAYRSLHLRMMPNIICLVKDDYELAKKWYRTKATYHYAFYPNVVNTAMLDSLAASRGNAPVKTILLGHAASSSNQHHEVLDWLKTSNNSFKVICPLSYGNQEYAAKVSEYGKMVLGERFIPIFELLKPEAYADLLKTVDVAIMNHPRQEALGNIIALLYLGKKVYVRRSTVSYNLFDKMGVKVFDTVDLLNNNQEDLFAFDPLVSKRNREIIKREFSEEKSIELWKKIFES